MKVILVSIILSFMFSGCLGVIMATGTAASVALTAKEVEEDYDNDVTDYIMDKSQSLYDYVNKKIDENTE